MIQKCATRFLLATVVSTVVCGLPANAQISVNLTAPAFDRWDYPFAGSPGGSSYAAVFAPLTGAGFDPLFDNRDGQMTIGFNTASLVTPGLSQGRYQVLSATVRLTVESNGTFQYDPTPDSYRTWLPPDDPNYLADSDPGHAVELFGTDFRNGLTPQTFSENTPFSTLGSFGKGIRNAFPAAFVNGACADASNNVDQAFDPAPFAIGLCSTVTPGQSVPAGSVLTFTIDVSNTDISRYLRRSLNRGVLDFSIASIFPSEQQTAGTYPRFYTRENLAVLAGIAHASQLDMVVSILPVAPPAGDVNGNGSVNIDDLLSVINAWGPCSCCAADVNADNVVNIDDLLAVINTWG